MKKTLCFLLTGLLVICLSACGLRDSSAAAESDPPPMENSSQNAKEDVPPMESNPPVIETDEPSSVESDSNPEEESSHTSADPSAEESDAAPMEDEISNAEDEEETSMEQTAFYVTVGGTTFSATFADNSGAQALKELLADGDITIEMSDYAGFEKVGSLGQSLPTSNSQTTTQAGDIVLYQGNQIVVFYGSNSWSYTRLGKIDDLTGWTEALGSGSVSVTFSLQG